MAQEVILNVDAGANLLIEINVSYANGDPWNLSAYDIASQFRKNPYTNTAYSFAGTGYSNGLLTLTMNAATSAAVSPGRYVYDVEVTSQSTNTTTRVQEGLIVFHPNITLT
jgi:hypothetical protein